jgi:hypothetical protein
LVDPEGFLWMEAASAIDHANPEEVEREVREQIELAMRAGIEPTHIDSHMWTLLRTNALFDIYSKVSHEYHLPFRGFRGQDHSPTMQYEPVHSEVAFDRIVGIQPNVRAWKWTEFYEGVLKGLRPGITELIVHLGYDDAELRAITEGRPGWDAPWRQRDFDVVTSSEFNQLVEQENIVKLGWRELKDLHWRKNGKSGMS